jgi:hypothetical protein
MIDHLIEFLVSLVMFLMSLVLISIGCGLAVWVLESPRLIRILFILNSVALVVCIAVAVLTDYGKHGPLMFIVIFLMSSALVLWLARK